MASDRMNVTACVRLHLCEAIETAPKLTKALIEWLDGVV